MNRGGSFRAYAQPNIFAFYSPGPPTNLDEFRPVRALGEKFRSRVSALNLQPRTYLRLWEWREDQIIDATQSITVREHYESELSHRAASVQAEASFCKERREQASVLQGGFMG